MKVFLVGVRKNQKKKGNNQPFFDVVFDTLASLAFFSGAVGAVMGASSAMKLLKDVSSFMRTATFIRDFIDNSTVVIDFLINFVLKTAIRTVEILPDFLPLKGLRKAMTRIVAGHRKMNDADKEFLIMSDPRYKEWQRARNVQSAKESECWGKHTPIDEIFAKEVATGLTLTETDFGLLILHENSIRNRARTEALNYFALVLFAGAACLGAYYLYHYKSKASKDGAKDGHEDDRPRSLRSTNPRRGKSSQKKSRETLAADLAPKSSGSRLPLGEAKETKPIRSGFYSTDWLKDREERFFDSIFDLKQRHAEDIAAYEEYHSIYDDGFSWADEKDMEDDLYDRTNGAGDDLITDEERSRNKIRQRSKDYASFVDRNADEKRTILEPIVTKPKTLPQTPRVKVVKTPIVRAKGEGKESKMLASKSQPNTINASKHLVVEIAKGDGSWEKVSNCAGVGNYVMGAMHSTLNYPQIRFTNPQKKESVVVQAADIQYTKMMDSDDGFFRVEKTKLGKLAQGFGSYRPGIAEVGKFIFVPRFVGATGDFKTYDGEILSISSRGMEHNSTTESGDSGSPVITEDGVCVGFHYKGTQVGYPHNALFPFTATLVDLLFRGQASAGQK